MENNSKPKDHTNVEALGSYQHSRKTDKSCKPVRKFIYIKTMKTGSSTLACILLRYGLKNELIAALQQKPSPVICYNVSSGSYDIMRYNCKNFPGYDFMANHILYHRAAMEGIVKNAKYITILRSPNTMIRSRFFYTNMFESIRNLRNSPSESNPFLTYLKSLEPSGNTDPRCCEPPQGNDLSRRLGVCAKSRKELTDKIRQLDKELDLVLLTEYYDESLILLKKMMCWEYEDIVYYPLKVNKNPLPPITGKMKSIIDKISIADMQLYNHFNKTLWEKVKNYDGDFEADLTEFHNIKKRITEKCDSEPISDYCNLFYMDTFPMTKLLYSKQLKWLCPNP
ncbi:galactosylceramide sulfotransferase-like [Ptychodera flava]|uniref:galactosylceramide sulfotransferase-like n=1 Tax=Ptychodera flava TaxID=63121 RepID=UPI00396A6714